MDHLAEIDLTELWKYVQNGIESLQRHIVGYSTRKFFVYSWTKNKILLNFVFEILVNTKTTVPTRKSAKKIFSF